MRHLRPAIVMIAFFTLLTGVLYPLSLTGFNAAVGFHRADPGQEYSRPQDFWGRLSAAGYKADASSGSNLGPLNPKLVEAAQARIDALKQGDPENQSLIPVDLVTSSGSGLDPDISPAGALYQVGRVAKARKLPRETLEALIKAHTETPLLGPPTVNVAALNRALDTP